MAPLGGWALLQLIGDPSGLKFLKGVLQVLVSCLVGCDEDGLELLGDSIVGLGS